MGPYLAQPNTEKRTRREDNLKNKLKYSFCEMQGWRRTMQDAAISELQIGNGNSLFAVFDGHGGPQVSKLVQKLFTTQLTNNKFYKQKKYKQALIDTFKKVDQYIVSKQGQAQLSLLKKKFDGSQHSSKIAFNCGCTANVVLITPTKIITANCGDSRAVLCRKGTAYPLSKDHKPQNYEQEKRIRQAGGDIINGRVNGGLNLSRSLGDFSYKQNRNLPYDCQLISSKPDVMEMDRSPNDEFIILGCDGIWQRYVKDSQPLITRIWNQKKSGNDSVAILKSLMDYLLARETSEENGCDNMSVILVQFI